MGGRFRRLGIDGGGRRGCYAEREACTGGCTYCEGGHITIRIGVERHGYTTYAVDTWISLSLFRLLVH